VADQRAAGNGGEVGSKQADKGQGDRGFPCLFILGRLLLCEVQIMSAQIYMDIYTLEAA